MTFSRLNGCRALAFLSGALVMGQLAFAQNTGPVRMARISYLTGKASWRPDGTVGWNPAALNLPLRQGAELWLAKGSRLELQFDDGTTLRLGQSAVATLQTLYSDNQGEFTEVKLNAGTSTFHLKDKYSIYQVDTPCDSVKSIGPSQFRIDVGPRDALAVRSGSATLTANGHDTRIPAGDHVVLASSTDPVRVEPSSRPDNWDNFNNNRDALLAETPAHVPTDIGIVSGGLDRHGHWHFQAGYGWVWSPVVAVGWRPYHNGHWTWVDPFGWTWVSDDPWGWAPYHYGTWAHFGFGWGWCPGPAVQCWSPARVDFVDANGYVSWVPLAPADVVYPAFSVGFTSGNWTFDFSIGGCGVYEPFGLNYCSPVFFPAAYFGPGWRRHGWDPGWWGHNRFAASNFRFVPRNAAFGAVGTSNRSFGTSGRFDSINRNMTGAFRSRPQVVANRAPFSGPVNIRPSVRAFSPTHSVASNARPAALNRALYRAPLSSRVARASGNFGPTSNGRAAAVAARTGTARGRVGSSAARVPSSVAAARRSIAFRGRNGTVNRSASARHAFASRTNRTSARRTSQSRSNRQTVASHTQSSRRASSVRTRNTMSSVRRGTMNRQPARRAPQNFGGSRNIGGRRSGGMQNPFRQMTGGGRGSGQRSSGGHSMGGSRGGGGRRNGR